MPLDNEAEICLPIRDIGRFFEDFDDEPRQPPQPDPTPAPPMFTAADLVRVQDEAFAAGRGTALDEAARSDGRLIAETLQAIAAAVADIERQASERIERLAEETAWLVLNALEALFPELNGQFGPREAAAAVGSLLPLLADERELIVSVGPAALDLIAGGMTAESPRVRVVADAALLPGDVRVLWQHGSAMRDGVTMLRAVLAAIQPSRAFDNRVDTIMEGEPV